MKTLDAHPPDQDPTLLKLLAEYQAALEQSAPMSSGPDDEGDHNEGSATRWVPRVRNLDDVDAAQLAQAHGRLIALGWLNFQVTDRTAGLCYRVSSEGRAALSTLQD